ncbi:MULTISPECIES: DUF2089 domain-containing protein [Fervidobacterium]|uniref:DUF2089 domain-containing protein n=1 Tax=Fervidobacterium nodosum (strain ATCC 35602 / DSM 5306 / Rt17-B1) TaxID=381764 RepID=A7HJA4_FERNB|nr:MULTISPECIES: DUF2089 domain-containing protein [Fervidobacterium]ABS59987.1 conserved hypothetical protein [Fervidobacterium nodosum Rt17-B1]HOJ95059.1 DUF2089 domain-containing protein [Fervidobacterium nodosum]
MPKMLPRCPVCGKPMKVTQLKCEEDSITVSGYFEVPEFCFLDEEDTRFIVMFLRTKGNLKELERLTGIGYFALRGRLDKVLEKMGLTPIEELTDDEQVDQEEVFKLLKEKKITVEEAISLLKKKGEK